jgi:hypothetical protein
MQYINLLSFFYVYVQFLSIMDKDKTFFLRLLVLLLPITFLFSSCDEVEELFGMNTVTVTPNKLQFDNKASCDTVVVNCNGVWRVTARPDWVTVLGVTKEDGICEFQLTDLKPNTNYKYRAYYEIKKMYGEQRTFATEESESCTDGNHVHAVDLGLSVKWACCNVGAGSPEGYGSYFAWGETSSKSDYDWDTYKFRTSGDDWDNVKFSKYNTDSDYGPIDTKTTLDLIDDAARSNWGGSWRMPTYGEQDELREKCTWTWTTLNGIKGYKVTSKSNGNSIFLPAAGYRNGTDIFPAGSYGVYWSSSLSSDGPFHAYFLDFYSDYVYWDGYDRYYGHAVRAVCP